MHTEEHTQMTWAGQPGRPVRRARVAWLTALFLLLPGQAALSQNEHDLPLVLSASSGGRDGFVRIINRSDQPGEVDIEAIDDSGQRFGPVSLSIDANGAKQFNSRDLEEGSSSVGLSAGVGDGDGDWRLKLRTTLDIEPLAYVRTSDGFLTSMHDLASEEAPMRYRAPIFNPGSNQSLESSLRLVNPGDDDAEVVISGVDAKGNPPPMGDVRLSLPAGTARTVTAQQLEEGDTGLTGGLGDGEGKWQLSVTSSVPLQVLSLMQTRSGHLTNLSQGVASETTTIPLMLPYADVGPQGFVRLINRSDEAGEVRIHAIDDSGRRFGPESLALGAKGGAQFNSEDLEQGNPGVGLSTGVGDGTGNWRLELDTTLDIEPLAYVRTADGFLTSMHQLAPEEEPMRYRVPIFNPGSNQSLESSLRLINPGAGAAEIVIDGLDAKGNPPPMGDVSLSLPAGEARTLTAQHLEEGASDLTGRLGDGEGKWALSATSSTPIQVMSLMRTRSGHLTNLSTNSQRPPPLDHSDTPEGATDITNLGSIQGTIDSPDDVDYFTFTLTEEAEVEIEVSIESDLEDLVFEIELLDSDGNVVQVARTDTVVAASRLKGGSDSATAAARAETAPKYIYGAILALGRVLAPGKKWYLRLGKALATEVVGIVLDNPIGLYKLTKRLITGEHCPRLIQEDRPPFAIVHAGGSPETVDLLDFIWTPEDIPLEFELVPTRLEGVHVSLREHHVTVSAQHNTRIPRQTARVLATQPPPYSDRCSAESSTFDIDVEVRGYAPTSQSAFDGRFVGRTISPSSIYSLSFISPGRFRERVLGETYFGSYTYRSTALSTGTINKRNDDGDSCTFWLEFDSFLSGTAVTSCLGSNVTVSWSAR